MEIYKDIEIVNLALYLKKHKVLVISDTHIGYEEYLQKQGVLLPKFQFSDLKKDILSIIKVTKPKKIIITGDIKQEFGTISKTEWKNTLELIDVLSDHGELVLLKGNHDTILGPIAEKKNIVVKEYEVIDDIYFCHGDIIPDNPEFKKAKLLIIGHEHPSVTLRERNRAEKFKCFLKGKYKDKTIIVIPSFNPLTTGTDVLEDRPFSPFLTADKKEYEVYLVGDKIRYFGKAKNLLWVKYHF